MELQRIAVQLALGVLMLCGTAAAQSDAKQRLLTVSGEGEVRVAPDRADVGVAVEAAGKSLAEAESDVTEGVGKILKLCDKLEIPRAQVRSAQLTVQPQYEYGGGVVTNRPEIVGYVVARHIDIEVKDLAKLGKLLQGAVEAGANRITGPSFSSSKKDEHQRTALAAAAEDARANAQALAKALGVKLGRLHSLSAAEAGSVPTPVFYAATRMKAGGQQPAPEQTYEPGEIRFTATVTADFALSP